MDSIRALRSLFSVTQAEMAAFLGIKRAKYSMIELRKRGLDPIKLKGLHHLLNMCHKAQVEPDADIVNELQAAMNHRLIAELIAASQELNQQIKYQESLLNDLEMEHQKHVSAVIILKMLEKEDQRSSMLTGEQKEWLAIQMRQNQARLNACSAMHIEMKRTHIKGLYTQLDHIKWLLQK